MSWLNRVLFSILFVLFVSSLAKENEMRLETNIISGIEFEDYYAVKEIKPFIDSLRPNEKAANIVCHYFGMKNTKSVAFYFLKDSTICNVFWRDDNETKQAKKVSISRDESNKLTSKINELKPYLLPTIEDNYVNDGLTTVVETIYNRYNIFSVRAFSKKSRNTSQYKFVKYIAEFLNDKGINIDL